MNYHDIQKDNMLNGDGLRVVLFVSGCDHKCEGCQNPQTWNAKSGIIFDESAKQEIFEALEKPYCSGITYCGGDPLFHSNIKEVTQLAQEIKLKFPDKTQWLYTGDLWEDIKHYKIMQYLDVVIDGPFMKDLADVNYPWAGSTNQRVIDVQKSLHTIKPVLHKTEGCKTDYVYDENLGKCISCTA